MDRQHYLYLIIDTYFETKNPVASEPTEPMFDLQIKLFQQKLIREQKKAEREDFITKEEFVLQCELALDALSEYVSANAFLELQRLDEKKRSIEKHFFDHNGIIRELPQSVVSENEIRIQNEIESFDEEYFLVELSGLNPLLHWKLCINDVEFIKVIFKNFNFEAIQLKQNINIDKYNKSFDVTSFGESADKRNPDNSKNDFYQGETFITWLDSSNLRVRQYKEPLIQKKDELINFNHTLHTLVNNTIRLYKQIRLYDSSFGETGIYLAQKAVLQTLNQIEFYSKKIKHYVLDSEVDCAILFKTYCVEKFEEIIFNIEDVLFIRVYDSPLKENFEKVKDALHSSINLEELKIIGKFNKPEQSEFQHSKPMKQNKSLLFDGKELNLSERFKIANKVLDIDNKLRTLNIRDLEKYQLLAYILGCDKDNARNLMNGSYKSKDRDLTAYFDELKLKK